MLGVPPYGGILITISFGKLLDEESIKGIEFLISIAVGQERKFFSYCKTQS
jgi:hypothetical protein